MGSRLTLLFLRFLLPKGNLPVTPAWAPGGCHHPACCWGPAPSPAGAQLGVFKSRQQEPDAAAFIWKGLSPLPEGGRQDGHSLRFPELGGVQLPTPRGARAAGGPSGAGAAGVSPPGMPAPPPLAAGLAQECGCRASRSPFPFPRRRSRGSGQRGRALGAGGGEEPEREGTEGPVGPAPAPPRPPRPEPGLQPGAPEPASPRASERRPRPPLLAV